MQCFLQLRKTFIFSLRPAFLGSQSHSPGRAHGSHFRAGGSQPHRLRKTPPGAPQAGGREGNWWPCGFVLLRPLAAARGAGTHPASPRPSSSTPPLLASTFPTSKGAALTAPHEIIIHYVTKREERESKYLDGIRGNPRRDDLGAVIIHLIGAWGKLLDREWN